AIRVPGRHRHGDSQRSAATARRDRECGDSSPGRDAGRQDNRSARSGDDMDLGIQHKVAMVGGASKGLGYAVARALAGEGARVSIASRDGDAVRRAAATIHKETGAEVLPVADLALSNVLRGSVSALAKTLSLEPASSRIRVRQLIPGRIETDRLRQLGEGNAKRGGVTLEDHRARAAASIPLGRYGAPDE